jgi:hypothetical protein
MLGPNAAARNSADESDLIITTLRQIGNAVIRAACECLLELEPFAMLAPNAVPHDTVSAPVKRGR